MREGRRRRKSLPHVILIGLVLFTSIISCDSVGTSTKKSGKKKIRVSIKVVSVLVNLRKITSTGIRAKVFTGGKQATNVGVDILADLIGEDSVHFKSFTLKWTRMV